MHSKLSIFLFSMVLIFAFVVIALSFSSGETPDALTHTTGTVDSGDIESFRSVDNDFYNVSEVAGVPGLNYELTLTDTDLTGGNVWLFLIRCFYDGSLGHDITLQVYDNNLASYVDIIDFPDGLTVSNIYENKTSSTDWINGDGNVTLRIYHSSGGNINHDFGVDYLEVIEQNHALNNTFNQQVDLHINSVDTNAFRYNSNDYALKVNNTILVDANGLMMLNNSIGVECHDLTISSTGHLRSTRDTIFIDGSFNNNGVNSFNANYGNIEMIRGNENLFGGNAIFHNLTINPDIGANLINGRGSFKVNHTLTMTSENLWTSSITITIGNNTNSGVISGGTFARYTANIDTKIYAANESHWYNSTATINYGLSDLNDDWFLKWGHWTSTQNIKLDADLHLDGNCSFRSIIIESDRATINANNYILNCSSLTIANNSIDQINDLDNINLHFDGTITTYNYLFPNITQMDNINTTIIGNFNCTQNVTLYGNIIMGNDDYLILSGNGSQNDSSFNFYPGNNSYTNIIQYNGTYNVSEIGNNKIWWDCDNFTQYGFIDADTLEGFGSLNIFQWNSNYFNFTTNNIVLVNNIYGQSTIYNLQTNNFNYTFGGVNERSQSGLRFGNDLILWNGTLSGINSIRVSGNLTLNGILNTINYESIIFFSSVSSIYISNNAIWEINNRLDSIDCYNLVVDGELRYLNYTTQTNLFNSNIEQLVITVYTDNIFSNSSGEINLSANINYPLSIIGSLDLFPDIETNISVSNLSDYYFNNIEFWLLNNSESEYITANGVGFFIDGNFDFLPPTIQLLELINNTVFTRNLTNIINISAYFEELSYFHSYYLQVLDPSSNIIYELSVNLSTPLNNTNVFQNINITNYVNGQYTFKIFVNDTHNTINKLDKYKYESAISLKIKVDDKADKIGYYDNHKLKTNGKNLYVYDYLTDDIKYWIEFENSGDHEIIYNLHDLNFKMIHWQKVKDNRITFKICSNHPIQYFENSYYAGHFIIDNIYAYTLQDWIEYNGTLQISNLMKEKDYDYYTITLFHSDMIEGENFKIDPLSMVVNSNASIFYWTVTGVNDIFGNITINPTPQYQNLISNYTINITFALNNISKYIVRSNINGEFWNNSGNQFDNSNLSVGTHTITFYVINDIGDFILLGSVEHIIFPVPIAKIDFVNVIGNKIHISGSYVQISNNTIIKYAWRTNVTGEFYNGTINPITLIDLLPGEYTLYFKILDENGIWSDEVNTTFSISNTTVIESNEYWWVNAENFIVVISMILFVIGVPLFLGWILYTTAKSFGENSRMSFK